jgi:hypothetical protein
MAELTYTPSGQTIPAGGSGVDPSLLNVSLGGTRVLALWSAYQQVQALQQNLSLAQQYYNENVKDFNFWVSTYQGKMSSALTEGIQRPFYTTGNYTPQYGALDYQSAYVRGQSKASLIVDRAWFNARRNISKYNTGQGHRADVMYALKRLNAEFNGWNLGFRYEDNRKMMYDEQRHAHQAEILNLGIGATNAVRSGLATSVEALSEARSQKAGEFGALSNELSTFAGYMQQTQGIKDSQRASTKRQYGLATSQGSGAANNTGVSGGMNDRAASMFEGLALGNSGVV